LTTFKGTKCGVATICRINFSRCRRRLRFSRISNFRGFQLYFPAMRLQNSALSSNSNTGDHKSRFLSYWFRLLFL